jgi:hypothetical protein
VTGQIREEQGTRNKEQGTDAFFIFSLSSVLLIILEITAGLMSPVGQVAAQPLPDKMPHGPVT